MRKRYLFLTLLLIGILCLSSCEDTGQTTSDTESFPDTTTNEMQITFFNAGKADCFLIQTDNSAVIIDTGKNKMGNELVSHCKKNNIKVIDAMIITHFDNDHVGGADKILKELQVNHIYEPAYTGENSRQYAQYRSRINPKATNLHSLEQSADFAIDGIQYHIDVADQKSFPESETNNISLVTSLYFKDQSFLFTGDIEEQRIAKILNDGINSYTFIKVPHHGSYSFMAKQLIQTVNPKYAVITSSAEEPEDERIINALNSLGTTTYLTRNGTVNCWSDGTEMKFSQKKIS